MKTLQEMTDEELEQHCSESYSNWMFYETADRGYDYANASRTSKIFFAANYERVLRQSRKQSQPLAEAIDLLFGLTKP